MVPNPTPELLSADPGQASGNLPTSFSRIRFRFEKSGPFRWLSHHDLIRAIDRLLRRIDLPVVHSQGFHPQPAIVFALSLPMGAIGLEEVVELDFEGMDWIADDLVQKLNLQSPPGLLFRSGQKVGPKDRARVVSLEYRVEVPESLRERISAQIDSILASPNLFINRTGADATNPDGIPSPTSKDFRNSLDYLRLGPRFLEIGLIPRLDGTVKPTELLARLGWPLDSEEYPQPQLERSRLRLENEQNIPERSGP